MARRAAWLAATLAVVACTGRAQPPAAGASQPTGGATAATVAQIEAEHHRQHALCLAHPVAAVRRECLHQADRSRAQALARLPPAAASRPASGR